MIFERFFANRLIFFNFSNQNYLFLIKNSFANLVTMLRSQEEMKRNFFPAPSLRNDISM